MQTVHHSIIKLIKFWYFDIENSKRNNPNILNMIQLCNLPKAVVSLATRYRARYDLGFMYVFNYFQ